MDLYDSLLKQKENELLDEIEKFSVLVDKYASHGFDEDGIVEMLQIDGCSVETSKKLASGAISSLPYKYTHETPPESFMDVVKTVKNTILSSSIDDLEKYFKKYADYNEFKGIINRILLARDSNSDLLVSEVIQELEPLVDDLIITNKALSLDNKIASTVNEKEKTEQKLFGVWPVNLVKERNNIDIGDKKVISRSKISPGNISFI